MAETVLITGVNGHIGRHLSRALSSVGTNVIGVSLEPTPKSALPGLTYVKADVCDQAEMDLVFREYQPAAVIHLAALVHGRPGQFDWSDYSRVNFVASHQLFEAAKACGVRRLIFASTVEVYGATSGNAPISEDTKCRPESDYARTKLLAEAALQSVARDADLAFAILRFAPVYAQNFRLNLDKRLYLKAPEIGYFFHGGVYRLGLCSLRNIEYFVMTWLTQGSPISGTYNLADRKTYSVKELLAMERRHGRAKRQVPLPYLPALMSISSLEVIRSAMGKPPNMLTAYNLRKLVRSTEWDVARAESAVGKLPFGVEDTLYAALEELP